MTRRVFNLLTALSLLLCVAVAGLWARSLVRQDVVSYAGDAVWSLESGGGELRLRVDCVTSHRRFEYHSGRPNSLRWIMKGQRLEKRELRLLGFGYGTFRERMAPSWRDPTGRMTPLWKVQIGSVPYWFILVLAAGLPVRSALKRRVRHGRRRWGACTACGYDLRATPGRCPECGRSA